MVERIKMLEDFFRHSSLNTVIYTESLVNWGRELNEGECLQSFDIIKLGIEIILDEYLEEKAKNRRLMLHQML